MAKWLVTVEQRYSQRKTNMIITTLEDFPSVEEVQKIIEQANHHHDPRYATAHVITFMQKLKED